MGQLFKELKRRNVIRVGVAYVVVAWLLLQVADVILPTFKTPDWVMQAFTFLLVLGFPLALIFAWAFELTPEGIKLEKHVVRDESITHATGRKLDFAIIAMLVVALAYFGYDKFVLDPSRDAELVQATTEALTEQVTETALSASADKSIAVLAFADMSPEGDQEYFSDGISEEILNLLVRVPGLRVTSRSSAFSFKGQNLDVPTMAARLNVAHVLEGSVRKSGNQLRIVAQLIEVESDTHLWSESYDRELTNVFAIQDEIALAVVDALKITLLGEVPKATETNPESYALYLQGLHLYNQRTAVTHQQAEARLKEALAIDPGFAPAWTALGRVYSGQADPFGLRSISEGYELMRDADQRALDIDPQYGRAYAHLAFFEMDYGWDFTAASEYIQRALALNPGDAIVLEYAGYVYRLLGRLDEAIDLQRQSVGLDPLSPNGHYRLGRILYEAYRLDEAADSIQMAMSLSPDWLGAHYRLGRVLLAQGDALGALLAMEQETAIYYRLTGTAVAQHALGDAKASDAALQALLEYTHVEFPAAYQIAEVYAFRGGIDHAFDWLEQAYNIRDTGLSGMLTNPLFANLHDDPRWEAFLDKMGLPH